jgi:hypothetical protein
MAFFDYHFGEIGGSKVHWHEPCVEIMLQSVGEWPPGKLTWAKTKKERRSI